jgi:hypothetical protein
VKQDNTPERLEKLIRDQSYLVYRKEMNSHPYQDNHAYNNLWKEKVVGEAVSIFKRVYGGNMSLDENSVVIPKLEEEVKTDWIDKLKRQHQESEKTYWRRKEIKELIKKEEREQNKDGNTR